jgi:hypothetical protein
MQALSPISKAVHRGLSYLRQAQRSGGGFPLGGNGSVNTQSTAWAIQGILAAGGDPGSFRRGGASAPEYLAHRQESDGHYRYSKSSDQTPVWVTGQVLVAAAGDYYPVPVPAREPTPAQNSTATGGVVPGTTPSSPPTSVPPSTGSSGVPGTSPSSPTAPGTGSGAGAGGGATVPKTAPNPGGSGSGAPSQLIPPSGEEADESTTAIEPAMAETSSEDDSESGPAGAIALGLLGGGLLFATGLGARKLWMRQRYGL